MGVNIRRFKQRFTFDALRVVWKRATILASGIWIEAEAFAGGRSQWRKERVEKEDGWSASWGVAFVDYEGWERIET